MGEVSSERREERREKCLGCGTGISGSSTGFFVRSGMSLSLSIISFSLTFVLTIEMLQVELLVDRNMDDPTLPDVPELVVLYGQLLYIAHVTLPKNRKLKVEEDCEALLGMVRFCKDARGDASLRPVWYTEMGVLQAVNISTIQCAVGRVRVAGTPKRWGILDVNYGCASTTFLEDDDDAADASDDD
jgi:hypothetical protein